MTNESSPPPITAYPPPMPIRTVRQGINVPMRQGAALTGAGLLLASVPVGFATPSIPLGLPMAVVGAVLLGLNAVWARQWLDSALIRHPRAEQALPGWLVAWALGRPKR